MKRTTPQKPKADPTQLFVTLPLRMDKALDQEITSVSEKTKLNKQETARQALRKGLPVLLDALGAPAGLRGTAV